MVVSLKRKINIFHKVLRETANSELHFSRSPYRFIRHRGNEKKKQKIKKVKTKETLEVI